MKRTSVIILLTLFTALAWGQRTVQSFNDGWRFHQGHASQPASDFMQGTEYFNYLTKAASIHNEGPYILKFDDSSWTPIALPHDWALQIPYHPQASHSHGYRAVGYQFPENSVGWYRKQFFVPDSLLGRHIELQFDGIFRDATVWVNGFYMGREHSGYVTQLYDISDYLNYGQENVVCVRADASLQEGWFYEGAGIYRDTWLRVSHPLHFTTFGTFIYSTFNEGDYTHPTLCIETEVANNSCNSLDGPYQLVYSILEKSTGEKLVKASQTQMLTTPLPAKGKSGYKQQIKLDGVRLWDVDDPYLYTLRLTLEETSTHQEIDALDIPFGIREVRFTAEEGFFLNGRNIELKGFNMHQDLAGVGAAIPDAMQPYIIERLKSLGANAYRASHNPMSPALLDACDSLGILVIDENRLMGVNDEHLDLIERMIRRDRNHPSIILWSDGNEEWGLENSVVGKRVAASMRAHTHRLDPTRRSTVANAGGATMIEALDVVGYNYIIQNDVMGRHQRHPEWVVVGTEETTACGTRGIYFTDEQGRWMPSINRTDTTYENIIERGWRFYHETPWAAGIFYWTGFDYRGEPNPLGYPAVGSEFGVLDYCGFEKDEAWYLRSWWTDETVLHIFPHWNLKGHEGETVEVWAYSNCDEVELYVNGRSVGRQQMPRDGHLKWQAVYQPGSLRAVGYRNGRKIKEQRIYTTGEGCQVRQSLQYRNRNNDGTDICLFRVEALDKKGRWVPDCSKTVTATATGASRILGIGNGDPSFKGEEHPQQPCQQFSFPLFNGLGMVIVQVPEGATADLSVIL